MSDPARRLVFCFPYRGVGGVSLLFLRIAEAIQRLSDNREIFLVDYADGFMARNLASRKIRVIEYRDDAPCFIPEDSLVIFQSMTPWSIFPRLVVPPSTRLLFWNCYPYNLIPLLPGFRSLMLKSHRLAKLFLNTLLAPYRARMRGFTTLISSAGALVFMDRPNLELTRRLLGVEIPNPRFVPVAMPSARDYMRSAIVAAKPLRFAWVGRLADFKVHSLIRVLKDLAIVSEARRIRFDIIGDGPLKSLVEAALPKAANLEVCFLGARSPSELEDYLRKDTDAIFAMGTSALEAARLGVPSILLDISYGELNAGYTYRFIYQSKGFSLGDVLGETRDSRDGVSMGELVDGICAQGSEISRRCKDYFETHHSLGAVLENFLEAAGETRLTWQTLSEAGLLKKPFFYQVLVKARAALCLPGEEERKALTA